MLAWFREYLSGLFMIIIELFTKHFDLHECFCSCFALKIPREIKMGRKEILSIPVFVSCFFHSQSYT